MTYWAEFLEVHINSEGRQRRIWYMKRINVYRAYNNYTSVTGSSVLPQKFQSYDKNSRLTRVLGLPQKFQSYYKDSRLTRLSVLPQTFQACNNNARLIRSSVLPKKCQAHGKNVSHKVLSVRQWYDPQKVLTPQRMFKRASTRHWTCHRMLFLESFVPYASFLTGLKQVFRELEKMQRVVHCRRMFECNWKSCIFVVSMSRIYWSKGISVNVRKRHFTPSEHSYSHFAADLITNSELCEQRQQY